MKYQHLDRTGLQVSRLALGATNFGELTGETASFEIVDTALDPAARHLTLTPGRTQRRFKLPKGWERDMKSFLLRASIRE